MTKVFHPMKCDWDSNKGLKFLEWYNTHKVYHPGYDYNFGQGNDDKGADVVAIANGVVDYIGPIGKSNRGLGNFIVIEYPGYAKWSQYCHLGEVFARVGQKVKAGEVVATCGNTGTTWAHVHGELFGLTTYLLKKTWWRGAFLFYPSGKTKEWVASHYDDIVKFVEEENARELTDREWCEKYLPEADWSKISDNNLPTAFRSLAKRGNDWWK